MRGMTADESPRRQLYPEIEPYRTGTLPVPEPHEIYFEESGNPEGKPVVFVHGGPGSGTEPKQRRFFDPAAYRIVLFDQRGSGRSTPHASLENNTTWDLIADMELLREHLGIERWQLFGGSWGSTLSLAYAQTHPGRVTELVLRGVFLIRRQEIHWFYQQGADALFPDAWEEFLAPIPDGSAVARSGEDRFALARSRIECHYFVNGAFFAHDGQLLTDVGRIRHIPTVVVQGRYDVVGPDSRSYGEPQSSRSSEFVDG